MNRDKRYSGPESPAGLQWSQGAKNTWREYGTPAGDTSNYTGSSRAPKGETGWTSNYDGQRVSQREQNEKGRVPRSGTISTYGNGPPKGDTNPYYSSQENIHPQPKETASQSVLNLPPHQNWEKRDGWVTERSRTWYIDIITKKFEVVGELKKNPDTTAIAVNCGDYTGTFSPEQRTEFTNNIMIQVYNYEVPEIPNPFVPKFHSYKYIQGLLVFKCFDSKTAHWLTTLQFDKLWHGAKIEIFIERDFSKLTLCQVIIPEAKRESKEIFHLLKLQNKQICTNRWKLLQRDTVNSKIQLNIAIDEPSIKTLKTTDMKLYYGIGEVQFRVLKESSQIGSFSEFSQHNSDDVINPYETLEVASINPPKSKDQYSPDLVRDESFPRSKSPNAEYSSYSRRSPSFPPPDYDVPGSPRHVYQPESPKSHTDFDRSAIPETHNYSAIYTDPYAAEYPPSPRAFRDYDRPISPLLSHKKYERRDLSRSPKHDRFISSRSPDQELPIECVSTDPFSRLDPPLQRSRSPRSFKEYDARVNSPVPQSSYDLPRERARSPQYDRLRSPARFRDDRRQGRRSRSPGRDHLRSPPRYRDREPIRRSRSRDRDNTRSRGRDQIRSPPRYRSDRSRRSPVLRRSPDRRRSPPRGNFYRSRSPPRYR